MKVQPKFCRQPKADDVLLGRGKKNQGHAGNVFFQALVDRYQDEYFETTSASTKRKTSFHILDRIAEKGGRFLKSHSSGLWVEVSRMSSYTKTAQAFQYRQRCGIRKKPVAVKSSLADSYSPKVSARSAFINPATEALLDDMKGNQSEQLTLKSIAKSGYLTRTCMATLPHENICNGPELVFSSVIESTSSIFDQMDEFLRTPPTMSPSVCNSCSTHRVDPINIYEDAVLNFSASDLTAVFHGAGILKD